MISIIVPVYNAEKYLDRCLTNLVGQTYKDIEIILINDGSKDKSLEIGQKWAQKDARIRIIDQVNSGVSAARNAGIKAAKGEYIMFCDADDWYELNFCEKACKEIENCDCAIFNYYTVSCSTKQIVAQYYNGIIDIRNSKDKLFELRQKGGILLPVWNKIYRREVMLGLEFPLDIYMGEDWIYNMNYIENCNKIKIINTPTYNYYISNSNAATKKFAFDQFEKLVNLTEAENVFFKDVKNYNKNNEIAVHLITVLKRLKYSSKSKYDFKIEAKKLFNTEKVKKIKLNNFVGAKRKIFYLLVKLKCYNLLYILLKTNKL